MEKDKVLDIKHLTITHDGCSAVSDVSFHIKAGEVLALVGESGSGKSTILRSILRLHAATTKVEGNIFFKNIDLLQEGKEAIRNSSGKHIAVIFQSPGNFFNPLRAIGKHYDDFLEAHGLEASKEVQIGMLKSVGFVNPQKILASYVSELSGGMQQRVAIAMALTLKPALLLADEPTSALDAIHQEEILLLIKKLCHQYGTAVLFVTHNLRAAMAIADEIVILKEGKVIEWKTIEGIQRNPEADYTKLLWSALPRLK